MAKQYYASLALFIIGQGPVLLCAQEAENGLIGFADFAVFEKAKVNMVGIPVAKIFDQLNFRVVRLIVRDKASQKADHDDGGATLVQSRNCG